jgi:hypothetical protein
MHVPELNILSLFLTKENYNKYFEYIDLKYIKESYKELYYIYDVLKTLHSTVQGNISLYDLEVFFFSSYPDVDQGVYRELFSRLQGLSVSDEVGEVLLAQIKRRKDALKLSEDLFKVSQGLVEAEDLQHRVQSFYENRDDHQSSEVRKVPTNLEQLLHETYEERGLRWRLDCLNKSLGSLRKGDFGFIFARPETGKTTLLASESTGFLESPLDASVAWFNNEEAGNKVMLRVYQAYFGCTLDQLLANVKKFQKAFEEQVGDRFCMYDSATISRRDVERIVATTSPSVVIYDQIDKIKGFTNDREDLRLGYIYQWARELAKNSHAAIGVCQADGTAEGVRYLTMEHVANAKTAKQAEADWILGLGKTHQDGFEMVRYLNISKNKLFGDTDSLPELKHGKFEVLINPSIAQYEDIITYK